MQFTSQTARQAAANSHAKRPHTQAAELQLALYEAGLALRKDIDGCSDREERSRVASALASVAKGWQSMNDQRRVMKGVPLPGSRRPAPDAPKPAKASKPQGPSMVRVDPHHD